MIKVNRELLGVLIAEYGENTTFESLFCGGV